MTGSVHLALLGPPHLTRDSVAIQGFESRKAVAVLAYLVISPIPVPRSQLATLFWPHHAESRGRGNLRRVVHNLTTLLPGWVLAERHTVQFNPALAGAVDVLAFADLLAQGTGTALAAAAARYRGAFLDGVLLDDCPDAEEWLHQQRMLWQQCALSVLEDLAHQHRVLTRLRSDNRGADGRQRPGTV